MEIDIGYRMQRFIAIEPSLIFGQLAVGIEQGLRQRDIPRFGNAARSESDEDIRIACSAQVASPPPVGVAAIRCNSHSGCLSSVKVPAASVTARRPARLPRKPRWRLVTGLPSASHTLPHTVALQAAISASARVSLTAGSNMLRAPPVARLLKREQVELEPGRDLRQLKAAVPAGEGRQLL